MKPPDSHFTTDDSLVRILSCILVLFSSAAVAEVTTDDQLWLAAGMKAEVAQDLDASFVQHVRWADKMSQLDSVMPQIGLSYGVMPWLEVSTSYRILSEREKDGDMQSGYRLSGSMSLEHALGPVEFGYRFRGQRKGLADQDVAAIRLRHRGQLQFDTNTFVTPLASYELYSDPSADAGEKAQKSRLTAGAGFKLTKAHRLKLKYHHQLELDGDGDVDRIFIFAYRYGFSLVD